MLREKMQMIKSKYDGKPNKKKIESLIVFILILIITLIAINTIWSGDSKTKDNTTEESVGYKRLAENTEDKNTEDELEKKLEEILAKMEGVGKVSVMITYAKGDEIVPMKNESSKVSKTQETDSEGGNRVIEETDKSTEIVYSDGTKIETQTVINPVVKGAIVIAEGASNATVKSNIISAVEAITGLATYKVQVFEMN